MPEAYIQVSLLIMSPRSFVTISFFAIPTHLQPVKTILFTHRLLTTQADINGHSPIFTGSDLIECLSNADCTSNFYTAFGNSNLI